MQTQANTTPLSFTTMVTTLDTFACEINTPHFLALAHAAIRIQGYPRDKQMRKIVVDFCQPHAPDASFPAILSHTNTMIVTHENTLSEHII